MLLRREKTPFLELIEDLLANFSCARQKKIVNECVHVRRRRVSAVSRAVWHLFLNSKLDLFARAWRSRFGAFFDGLVIRRGEIDDVARKRRVHAVRVAVHRAQKCSRLVQDMLQLVSC